MRFQKNILLAKHTTFKIGGPAKYFCIAKNKEDLIKAVKKAKELKLSFFILGNGSNVLALDRGFDGLIIKIQSRFQRDKIENCNIYVEAGTKLKDLVKLSARKGLAGFEWLAGIPGTVGGAIYGNAQAFDKKMSDNIKTVEALDVKTLKIKKLSKKQCQFSNKNSIFKKNRNFTPYRPAESGTGAGLIIISAIFKLKKGNKKEIQKKIKEHLKIRKQKHPLNFPSAGSVFINKKGSPPSAFLIESAGLKGAKLAKAMVSKKHAGFIINLGGAKSKDVLGLIKIIKQKVKNKFGINLKEEIQIIK